MDPNSTPSECTSLKGPNGPQLEVSHPFPLGLLSPIKQFFVKPSPQWWLGNFPSLPTSPPPPWPCSLSCNYLNRYWFVLPAPEFCSSCSKYRTDLVTFNLSSQAFLSVFNQHQVRIPKWCRSVCGATGCSAGPTACFSKAFFFPYHMFLEQLQKWFGSGCF